jgi:hypothetical protein
VGLGIWELIRVSVTGFRFCLFRESETPFPPPAPKSRSIRGRAARESGQARPPSRPRRGERLRGPGALDPGPRRVVSERGFTYGPGPSTAASTPGARASKRAGGRCGPCVLGPSRALRAGGAHISSRSRQPLVVGVRGPPTSQGAGPREGVTVLGSAWPPSVWWWCGGIRRLTERFGGAHPLFGLFRFQPV